MTPTALVEATQAKIDIATQAKCLLIIAIPGAWRP